MDLTIHLHIVLRTLKHVAVTIQLFCIQTAEILPSAVTDEKRAEDNILDFLVISVDRSAGSHAVELTFIIADVMLITT